MHTLSYAYASRNTSLGASSDFPSRPLASQVYMHVWLSFFPPVDFLSSASSCPRSPSPVYLPSLSLALLFSPHPSSEHTGNSTFLLTSPHAHSSLFSLSMPSTVLSLHPHFLLTLFYASPSLSSFFSFFLHASCLWMLSYPLQTLLVNNLWIYHVLWI